MAVPQRVEACEPNHRNETAVKFKSNVRHFVIRLGMLAIVPGLAWPQANPCDLNGDGSVNVVDVQLAINMALGSLPCTANIFGPGVCNVVVVQRVINTVLGGTCITGTGSSPHSVDLNWTASISTNVVGYNVYRGSASSGPYAKLNSSLVAGITYTDTTVQAGQTYYYVATAVDNNNNESAYSAPPVQAIVPSW